LALVCYSIAHHVAVEQPGSVRTAPSWRAGKRRFGHEATRCACPQRFAPRRPCRLPCSEPCRRPRPLTNSMRLPGLVPSHWAAPPLPILRGDPDLRDLVRDHRTAFHDTRGCPSPRLLVLRYRGQRSARPDREPLFTSRFRSTTVPPPTIPAAALHPGCSSPGTAASALLVPTGSPCLRRAFAPPPYRLPRYPRPLFTQAARPRVPGQGLFTSERAALRIACAAHDASLGARLFLNACNLPPVPDVRLLPRRRHALHRTAFHDTRGCSSSTLLLLGLLPRPCYDWVCPCPLRPSRPSDDHSPPRSRPTRASVPETGRV
jgi:hypothetical protein